MTRKNKRLLNKITKKMNDHLHITDVSTEDSTTENTVGGTAANESTAKTATAETTNAKTAATETTPAKTAVTETIAAKTAVTETTAVDTQNSAAKSVDTEITLTAIGTEIDNTVDPSFFSAWPKLKQKVPNIFLHKPVDFTQHVHKLLSMGIKFKKARLNRFYTKIICPSLNDHKALVQYFEKKQLPFNTFGNLTKRKIKIVVRGLPRDIDLNMVKSELKLLSIPIVRVHVMKLPENMKDRLVLVLAVVPYNEEGKRLLQIKKIMGHEVQMEPANQKTKQCHRCQLWGHTQRYCHGQVKCVKCAGEHISTKCGRDPEKEPPKCANCGGDHTANYKKCPCYPETIEQLHKLRRHRKMAVQPRKTDLVTMENCDTPYKSVTIYKLGVINTINY